MLLVFFIILIIFFIIISLKFEIEIENFEYSNYKKEIPDNLLVKIRVFIINKIKIIEISFNKEKMKRLYSKKRLEKLNSKKLVQKLPKNNKEKIKILKIIQIEKLHLYIEIGTEELMLTIALIPIISTILSIIFTKKCNPRSSFYKIQPIYIDKNIYKINLDCIIRIKMIHIINIMWRILRKRDDVNERTSNTRTYEYGYEQH